jgi:hypothetical protein
MGSFRRSSSLVTQAASLGIQKHASASQAQQSGHAPASPPVPPKPSLTWSRRCAGCNPARGRAAPR